MKTKLHWLLAIVAAFAAISTIGETEAQAATTRWVNGSDLTPTPPGTDCANAGYMTISAAVMFANPGDTIRVCPGLYVEQVTIGKTLTLLGAQAGVDARS